MVKQCRDRRQGLQSTLLVRRNFCQQRERRRRRSRPAEVGYCPYSSQPMGPTATSRHHALDAAYHHPRRRLQVSLLDRPQTVPHQNNYSRANPASCNTVRHTIDSHLLSNHQFLVCLISCVSSSFREKNCTTSWTSARADIRPAAIFLAWDQQHYGHLAEWTH